MTYDEMSSSVQREGCGLPSCFSKQAAAWGDSPPWCYTMLGDKHSNSSIVSFHIKRANCDFDLWNVKLVSETSIFGPFLSSLDSFDTTVLWHNTVHINTQKSIWYKRKWKSCVNAMSVLKLVSVKKAVSDISISDGALHLSFAMVLLNSNKR